MTDSKGMQITTLDAPLGARVTGLDLNHILSGPDFGCLHAAWLERAVLLLPGQNLSEAALVRFSRRFGELELPPASENRSRSDGGGAHRPEIWNISNVRVDGMPIGSLGNLEADWHSDMSYLESPPAASILHAREIPALGGNTCFANMYEALRAMPAELRERLARLQIRHDSAYTSVGELRKGADQVDDVTAVLGATHPAIRVHPETGQPAIYLGRRLNASVVGLPLKESEALLDELWAFCVQPEFVYEHTWAEGDLIIWDNRCTLHRRDQFDDAERRVMWRTQVK
ncbi:MAG: TauD/TfdA family dioxygenase [Gammaproteobacteria bacterium]|nr:TauD/TfdA family dioxygenase [Gammaproteobacteria bacterium]